MWSWPSPGWFINSSKQVQGPETQELWCTFLQKRLSSSPAHPRPITTPWFPPHHGCTEQGWKTHQPEDLLLIACLEDMYFIICPGSPPGFFSLPFFGSFTPVHSHTSPCCLVALFSPLPATSEHSDVVAPAITACSLGCDLSHTGHCWALLSQEMEKHFYTPGLNPPVPALGAAALVTNLCRTTHGRGCSPWPVATGLLTTCLCGSPAQRCNYQSY